MIEMEEENEYDCSLPGNNGSFTIKEWAKEDRPREKMMAKGESALSNAELLAILIGSGSPRQSAVELMQDVLRTCDGHLSLLSKLTVKELMAFNGIGEAKAITIKAAAEIGRRRAMERADDLQQLCNAEDTYLYMHPLMQDLICEEFWVILMNNASRVIKRVRISTGGLTATAVDIRMVLKEALLADATCMIVCHNHPSGKLRPSNDDLMLTERLNRACQTVNIKLIDHVIITDGGYYSFVDNGKI